MRARARRPLDAGRGMSAHSSKIQSDARSSFCGAAEGGINAGGARRETPPRDSRRAARLRPGQGAGLSRRPGTRPRSSAPRHRATCYEELEHWGAVFYRTEDGRIARRPFGAAGDAAHEPMPAEHHPGPRADPGALRKQVIRRKASACTTEYFAWKLVETLAAAAVGADRLRISVHGGIEGDPGPHGSDPRRPGGAGRLLRRRRRTPHAVHRRRGHGRWRCEAGVAL